MLLNLNRFSIKTFVKASLLFFLLSIFIELAIGTAFLKSAVYIITIFIGLWLDLLVSGYLIIKAYESLERKKEIESMPQIYYGLGIILFLISAKSYLHFCHKIGGYYVYFIKALCDGF